MHWIAHSPSFPWRSTMLVPRRSIWEPTGCGRLRIEETTGSFRHRDYHFQALTVLQPLVIASLRLQSLHQEGGLSMLEPSSASCLFQPTEAPISVKEIHFYPATS